MNNRRVLGLHFSLLSLDQIADKLTKGEPAEETGMTLFTANLDHIVKMRKNPLFRNAYDRATIITADGFPVQLYARWRGVQLPGRVTGADLFPALLERLSPTNHRPFFVVSDHTTALRLKRILNARGFETIKTAVPPFGFENDTDYSRSLARIISENRTTHLFFCVGAPKSEIWLNKYREEIGPCNSLALGMGANFFVGTANRAPAWVQKVGFEWFWRFVQEPERLFRRYFLDSWAFLLAIADDLRRKDAS